MADHRIGVLLLQLLLVGGVAPSRLPQTLSFYPAFSNSSSQFYHELSADYRQLQKTQPDIASYLERGYLDDLNFTLPAAWDTREGLDSWPSSVLMALVLDIPNLSFNKQESIKYLLSRPNLAIEAKAHFIQLMNDGALSSVIQELAAKGQQYLQFPAIKFILLQKIIKGRIASVISWPHFRKLASSGILHKIFTRGLDLNSVIKIVDNEEKLKLLSMMLLQGERNIHEYIRKPICKVLLNHVHRLQNYRPISAWKEDDVAAIGPFIECLEPQMLPIGGESSWESWGQLMKYIAESNEIDPAICVSLIDRLDYTDWVEIGTTKKGTKSDKKFTCLRFASPEKTQVLLNWQWEEKYEIEMAIHGRAVIQDLALQMSLSRIKIDTFKGSYLSEKQVTFFSNTYLHVFSYEELNDILAPHYISIEWGDTPDYRVEMLSTRAKKQVVQYVKDHRIDPKAPWSEDDLKSLGPFVQAIKVEDITSKNKIIFYKDTGTQYIKDLSLPQKAKILSVLREILSDSTIELTVSRIDDYDIDLITCMSAHDLTQLIMKAFEQKIVAYSKSEDRIVEIMNTDLFTREWDTRISTIIYTNAARLVENAKRTEAGISDYYYMTGPLSESLGSNIKGMLFKDLPRIKTYQWTSVINSVQFFMGDKLDRGLAQQLADGYEIVIHDLFGEKIAEHPHTDPTFRMEMHLLGGRVLREIDPNFFRNVPKYLCREAFGIIGELKDNIQLPRKMRQELIDVYMSRCLRNPSLDLIDLVALGSLVCDLPADFLRHRANKTLLKERIHYFRGCSLTNIQGEALKQFLPEPLLSLQNVLNMQSAICSMVNPADLQKLSEDEKTKIAPSIPYIWRDMDPYIFSKQLKLSELNWDKKVAFFEGLDKGSQLNVASCLQQMAWIYATEFKPDYSSYYKQTECEPNDKRETLDSAERDKGSAARSCADMKDMGAALLLLPEEYYDNMNSCQLKRCVSYIADYPHIPQSVLRRIYQVSEANYRREMNTDQTFSTYLKSDPLIWLDYAAYAYFLPVNELTNLPSDSDFIYHFQSKFVPDSEGESAHKRLVLGHVLETYLKTTGTNNLKWPNITILGNTLCGARVTVINRKLLFIVGSTTVEVTGPEFLSALHIFGSLQACTDDQLRTFKAFYESTQSAALQYSPTDLIDLNLIISQLRPQHINQFDIDKQRMISCDAIQRMTPDTMRQLERKIFLLMSPEQIRCLTPEQWKVLSNDQLMDVNKKLCSSPVYTGDFSCVISGREYPDPSEKPGSGNTNANYSSYVDESLDTAQTLAAPQEVLKSPYRLIYVVQFSPKLDCSFFTIIIFLLRSYL